MAFPLLYTRIQTQYNNGYTMDTLSYVDGERFFY